MKSLIRAFWLLMLVEQAALGQDDYYCLYEKASSYYNSYPTIISRNDWLSVAKCKEAANLGFHNLMIAPENQPNMSYAEAAVLHDIVKISNRFTNRCWRGYSTWIRYDTRQMTWNYQYPGQPYVIEMSNLCCEEAVLRANAGAVGQACTVITFLSTTNRAVVTPNGIFSLGGSITFRFRNWPPVVIPSMQGSTVNLPAGTSWNVKEIYAGETRTSKWVWNEQQRIFSAMSNNSVSNSIRLTQYATENVLASFEYPYYYNNVYYGSYTVQYAGKIVGQSIIGTVTWYWQGKAYVSGRWEVNFGADSLSTMSCDECVKQKCSVCEGVTVLLCEVVDGHPNSAACRQCIKEKCRR
jgi:hypothetical protein